MHARAQFGLVVSADDPADSAHTASGHWSAGRKASWCHNSQVTASEAHAQFSSAVSRFALNPANRFLESNPLIRDYPLTQGRLDCLQLGNVPAALVHRAAILCV